MSGGYYDDGLRGRPQFNPFTRDSLSAIEARIADKEAKKKTGEDQVVSVSFYLFPLNASSLAIELVVTVDLHPFCCRIPTSRAVWMTSMYPRFIMKTIGDRTR